MNIRAAIVLVGFAGSALAGNDTYGVGDGHAGAAVITSGTRRINSYAALAATAQAGAQTVTVLDVGGFVEGDLILLLQPIDDLPPQTRGPDAGALDLSNAAAGRYELARVTQSGSGTLGLDSPLVQTFTAPYAQVIRVPEFTDVTLEAGAAIEAQPWNGRTGGVVAFMATGTITNQGVILANASGFRGGVALSGPLEVDCDGLEEARSAQRGESVAANRFGATEVGMGSVANGGGGGNCHNAGGGGGGNAGFGGRGGRTGTTDLPPELDRGGVGGAALSAAGLLERLPFGGGGGAGEADSMVPSDGAAGGGAVFIRARALAGGGTLSANGGQAADTTIDGAGGGGAGGSVYLRLIETARCGAIEAVGGGGGSAVTAIDRWHGPGGGGGGGRILLQAADLSGCPAASAPGLAGISVAAAGTHALGASFGASPTSSTDPSFQGTIERLSGPFSISPAPAPRVFAVGCGCAAGAGSALPLLALTLAHLVAIARRREARLPKS